MPIVFKAGRKHPKECRAVREDIDRKLKEIIENYDYMTVPTLFIGDEKIFEAALFMPYETIKEGVKLAFDKASEDSGTEDDDSGEDIHEPCLKYQK